MPSVGDKIVDISVALFILAAVGLLALTNLFTAPTTSIPATIYALAVTLVAVMFGIAVALLFYRSTKNSRERGIARIGFVPMRTKENVEQKREFYENSRDNKES